MIVGKRVQLIPLGENSFDLTFKWVNNQELRLFTGTRFPVSKYEHEVWFKAKATDKYNKTYAIQLVETNQIIGLIGNSDYDPINRLTKLFIYIGETEKRAKGLGQEAYALFSDFCFKELNVHKVYSYLYSYNKASIHMHEKCGFILEGELKQHWFKDGRYHDVIVMGRIKEND